MLAQLPLFPEEASTVAFDVDVFFWIMVAVTGAVAALVFLLLGVFAVRYRRRPGESPSTPRIMGKNALEIAWTLTPAVIFVGMFLWGAWLYIEIARPPADALEIYVVGKQWMWKIQHPEGQREINELHVPIGRPVKLTLTSEDVIHDFFVPAFRTKIDVLPGRYVQTWFQATKIGRYRIQCAQYCGTSHAEMIGYVDVMQQADYEHWLSQRAEGSLALEGRKLFLKLQCAACHSADSQARAPVLESLYRRVVHLNDGGEVAADEGYLRESIVAPDAKIVQGWQPIMPSYKGKVDEEDIIRLIAYIKSLGRGQTPVRTEEFPPPVTQPGTGTKSTASAPASSGAAQKAGTP